MVRTILQLFFAIIRFLFVPILGMFGQRKDSYSQEELEQLTKSRTKDDESRHFKG